jgi:Chromo (CHRromatin Organisation MOdifier) domain
MYLVRWKGYTRDNDLWEPEEHLENASEAIQAYQAQKGQIEGVI